MTDMPLDERRFHGVLHDVAASALAGAIRPCGLSAKHSFGAAEQHSDAHDLEVRVLKRAEAPNSALKELDAFGFRTASALEFWVPSENGAKVEAWALVTLYAEQLYGWVLTRYQDYESSTTGSDHVQGPMPVTLNDGDEHKAVLVSAESLVRFTP